MNTRFTLRLPIVLGSCLIGATFLLFKISAPISLNPRPLPTPVLVELFTSKGCSSCPSADQLLLRLDHEQFIDGTLVVPLSEHVDYWNSISPDPFSNNQFTERQRAYHPLLGSTALYTPEMIIDGHTQFVGSQAMLAAHAIKHAATIPKARIQTQVLSQNDQLHVDLEISGTSLLQFSSPVEVWIAVTETGLQTNRTKAINMKGRILHAAVVRLLKRVATIDGPIPDPSSIGDSIPLEPKWNKKHLRIVTFLQESGNRHIRGVGQFKLNHN